MILIIDNYDSFVYNLVRYVEELRYETIVRRHDAVTAADVAAMNPSAIILSPGPRGPEQAGVCADVVKNFYTKIPILGVCLGHQVIGSVFGAKVCKALRPQHGKASLIVHGQSGIFDGIETPLKVGRYHSLIVSDDQLPADLLVEARSDESEIMAMRHRHYPTFGVQFHPESILTSCGHQLIKNFLRSRMPL